MKTWLTISMMLIATCASAFCIICFKTKTARLETKDGHFIQIPIGSLLVNNRDGCVYLSDGEIRRVGAVKSYNKKGEPIYYRLSEVRGVWLEEKVTNGIYSGHENNKDFYWPCS